MYAALIHRMVLVLGFVAAVICFVVNIALGHELLHSAFYALCVMFGVSVVMLVALRSIARILFKFLLEQRKKTILEEKEEMAKKKLPL